MSLPACITLFWIGFRGPTRADAAEPSCDWGVMYYMPYDNDLAPLGRGIIQMIRDGVKSSRIVAAVQADFPDPGGMYRFAIQPTGMQETRIASDDSADEGQAVAFVEWFISRFPCRRYVVVFLDHGGKHDEMCHDEHPDTKGKHWMSGRILGEGFRRLKEKMPGQWELLFLQQCGRGSLENLYSFRGTANFIMASPVNVGAPNTYYTSLHKWLGQTPEATGNRIAAKICAEDRDYALYACVAVSKLDELPERLNAAIQELISKRELLTPRNAERIYDRGGEMVVDAEEYLRAVVLANKSDPAKMERFFEWVRGELLAHLGLGRGRHGLSGELCGLSLLVPTSEELGHYRGLDLYRNSRLPALWQQLLVPGRISPECPSSP